MNSVQTDTNKPRSGFAIAALVLGIGCRGNIVYAHHK